MSWRAQGLRAWLLQRLTAVYILVYMILAAWLGWSTAPADFNSWHQLFRHPVPNIATVFLFAAVFYHVWVGVRDILVDYVKPQPIRFTALVFTALLLLSMMLWIVFLMFGVLQA